MSVARLKVELEQVRHLSAFTVVYPLILFVIVPSSFALTQTSCLCYCVNLVSFALCDGSIVFSLLFALTLDTALI